MKLKKENSMCMWKVAFVAVLAILLASRFDAQAFQHPGIPLTVADLNTVKSNLNNWPWSDGYSQLAGDGHSQLTYSMQGPFATVTRNPDSNLNQWRNDMIAVWNLSRMWYFTSNSAYAQKARDIIVAWANTQTSFGGIESGLDLGDYAYRFAGGADILRGTWPGWTAADTAAVSNLFANVYIPSAGASIEVLGPANKGSLQMAATLACAVFNDDTNLFNHLLYLYRTSASSGLHYNALNSGETGETGRDQGHAYNHLLMMAFMAEVFYKQGVDVYSDDDNRLLACGEYWSRNNMNPAAAYITFGTTDEIYWNNSTGTNGNSAGGYFAGEPMAGNILRSAYVARKGLTAPWMEAKRYAAAGTTVVNAQGENMNSFMYLKTADVSSATPPAAVNYPASASATTGLINLDIGTVGVAGSGSYSGGTWTVTGGGADTWTHSADSLHFVYKQMTGDCTVIARVNSVSMTAATAKAGVMIRDSLSASAGERAWVAITASSTIEAYNHGWTQCYGGSNWEMFPYSGASGWKYTPSMPYWVKIERLGNTISTFISLDGTSWEVTTVAYYGNLPSTVYAGLYVCALNTSTACTASFSNVSITGGDGGNVTVPPAPYLTYASPGTGRVPLRWLPSYGATSYNVLRSTTSGGPYTTVATGITNASYVDTSVAPGTTYYYVITASNAAGTSGNSPQDSASTTPLPGVPTGTTVSSGSGVLRVGWTAAANASSYKVKRATTSGGPYTQVATTTSTGYLDTGLSNGTTYYYVVSAVNDAGESANSSQASGIPEAKSAISINFQGGSTQNGTPATMGSGEYAGWVIANNWNNAGAAVSGSQGSLVQNDGAATAASVNWSCNNLWSVPISESAGDRRMMKGYLDTSYTSTTTVTVSGLSSAYTSGGYDVYVYVDGDNGGTVKTGVYTIGSTTINATDAAGANFSGAFVQANNSSGNFAVFANQTAGSFTLSAVGSTADGGAARAPINAIQIVARTVTSPPPPAAPTGLNATAGNAQVVLGWTASSGATSYNVKRSTTSGSGYSTIGTTSSTGYTDTAVANGTTYYYVVSAVNTGGESANSSQVSATPQVTAPSAPSGLNATAGNAQVALSWTASSGATSYNMKRSTTSGGPYSTIASPTATSYIDTSAVNGTTYYYVVSAVNAGGESANSSQVSATPQAPGTLPSPWVTSDVGAVGAVGSASYSAGTFTVKGSGADIWGATDEFRYVYQTASGTCSIVARVDSVQNTHPNAKVGVMIRESLSANARHATVDVTPGAGIEFLRRTSTGGSTTATTVSGLTAPYWLKVARSGNTFTASYSTNGSSWTTIGSQSISMTSSTYIGLIVTSHADGTLCTGVLSNVTATP